MALSIVFKKMHSDYAERCALRIKVRATGCAVSVRRHGADGARRDDADGAGRRRGWRAETARRDGAETARRHGAETARRDGADHGCTKCNMRKLAFFRASSKWRHKSRSASSPNYKSVGDEPPSPLQCAAARQPMMALLLGSIEAPIKAYSQPARASEVT